MCYRKDCQEASVHNLNVCGGHLAAIAERISAAYPRLSAEQVADYAKINVVIIDRVTMNRALTYLGDQIEGFAASVADSDAINIDEMPILHFLLKKYEEKFGFGRDALMTGILSAEAFLQQLNNAYSVCDFGADADHGAFTHRFHWFAIMFAATGGNPEAGTPDQRCLAGGFSIPVVSLYKTLGTAAAGGRVDLFKPDGRNDGGKSLWAALFDLPDQTGGYYNRPDALHAAIRNQTVGNPALTAAVIEIQRGVVKRRLRVLNNLQFIGAVTVSPRRVGEGESSNISEREDLINAAIVGGNLVTFMRYRDVQVGEKPDGAFNAYSAPPTGDFFQGECHFGGRVSNTAIKTLANSLIAGGRWKWEYPNLLVRQQRINSVGEMVG